MEMCFSTGAIAYSPLSLLGPSRSIPMVFPSAENEWQFRQVGTSVSTVWLSGSRMSRSLQLIRWIAFAGSGCTTPSVFAEGIRGTSR